MAAAVALSGAPASASTTAQPTTTGPQTHANQTAGKAGKHAGAVTAKLLATTESVGKHAKQAAKATTSAATTAKVTAAKPSSYTVKSGDSLSAIAQNLYGDSAYWTAIYWANDKAIKYANDIETGQALTIPAKPSSVPGAPSELSAPAPAPVQQPVQQSSTTQSAPVEQSASVSDASDTASVSTSGDGSFQACVISRESGGDSQVMNSSGHYGLYQFSASTWAAYGGNPADFGDASAAEQNQVFDNAVSQGGESNWSAYDGC
ncbi:MAG TPA: transglycosylase family protein [Trebonia sp.]